MEHHINPDYCNGDVCRVAQIAPHHLDTTAITPRGSLVNRRPQIEAPHRAPLSQQFIQGADTDISKCACE